MPPAEDGHGMSANPPAPLQPAIAANEEAGSINLIALMRSLRRRKRLAILTGVLVSSTLAGRTIHQRITAPVYSGGFQLLISDPISAGSSASGTFANLARNQISVDLPTLTQALTSPMVLDSVRTKLGADAAVLNSISIQSGSPGAPSGILTIGVKGQSPGQVMRGLQYLSKAYLSFALTQRRERLSDGLSFLAEQEPEIQARYDAIQAKINKFRVGTPESPPSELPTSFQSEVAKTQKEIYIATTKISELERLQLNLHSDNADLDSLISSNLILPKTSTLSSDSTLARYKDIENQLNKASSIYRDDSAQIKALKALQSSLSRPLRDRISSQISQEIAALQAQRSQLTAQIPVLQQKALAESGQLRSYDDLKEQLDMTKNELENIQSTRSSFQLELTQTTEPWKVMSPPSANPFPEEPSLSKGFLLALAIGTSAGVGTGLLRDRLDHVFHTPSDVQEELHEPLLGHIPHVSFFKGVREDKRFLLQELDGTADVAETNCTEIAGETNTARLSSYNRFFYQEAFRNLFTSLRFLSSDRPLRSVALTSSLPAEGKTLVNVLLAKTLSEMGQRVLLVDADLRKPQMHYRLGLNNITGLSNLLTEPDLHWSDAIQTINGYDGWSVLTAGRRPPDPARLLSSAHMHMLVRELADSGQFDLVLYDTPPVLGLADAALVAQHLDGLMLLVSLERVDRNLPREAAARIRSSGATLLGLVTNAVREEEDQRGGYGYGRYGYRGYGYVYGYGYGYGAYDSRSTYAYYNNSAEDAPGDPVGNSRAGQLAPQSQSPLRRLQMVADGLRRWIDG